MTPKTTYRCFTFIALVSVACARRGDSGGARETKNGGSSDTLLSSTAANPPTPEGVTEYYSMDALRGIAESAVKSGNPTKTFGRHAKYWYVESQRSVTGSVEVHDDWTDAAIIQAGRGTLITGGRVTGGRLQSAGEHRGGRIIGGTEHSVAPGDFLIIPAGSPHQYVIPAGGSLRYLTVKIAK